jgi:stage V sporulation protein B
MRSALVTIEHILIPRGLEKSGSSRDMSLAAYGTLGSMVFPLVLFPSAVSASFAGLLIPEVAESVATGDERRIKGIVSTVLETVLIFAIGCAGVIMSFSIELGKAVYPTSNTAGIYILMIAPLIPVMYLDTAVDSMLKGLGEQLYTMRVNIADAFMSVLLVITLLPSMGIRGYVIVIFLMELFNTSFSIIKLLNITKIHTPVFRWVIKPLLCVVLATATTKLLFSCDYFYTVLRCLFNTKAIFFIELIACALCYLLFTKILKRFGADSRKGIKVNKGLFC